MVAPYVPISDIVPRNQFIAGLNQFVYSTNWTANNASEILVYSRAPNVPTSDVIQLVDPSFYTVAFIGADLIVQVTFLAGHNPPQYNIVTIMRDTPSNFLNLYTNTNFTPSMLNGDFETLTLVDQQNQLYWQQIVPRYNNSATINVPIDTILPILKANEFWIKNGTNTAFIPATLGSGGEFPVLGPFVLYTADSSYPNGFDLGAIGTGFLLQTATLDVATPYTIPIPLDVPHGGTGLTSITPYAVLLGNTTSTTPIYPLSDLGAAGQVLTSSGAGAFPSWQDVPPEAASPIGAIIDYAGQDLPTNYLVCDGAGYSTTTYSSLFAVIGYTWGGAGATFNVPNLAGRVTAGAGGGLLPPDTVGTVGGAGSETIAIANMPSHNHPGSTAACNLAAGANGGGGGPLLKVPPNGDPTTLPVTVSPQGGGTPLPIIQPTAIVQKLIKYQ